MPDELLDDTATLAPYLAASYAYVSALKPKPTTRRKDGATWARAVGADSGSRSARSGAHGHWRPSCAGGTVVAMPRHAPAERPIPRGLHGGEPTRSQGGHAEPGRATSTRADVLRLAALVDLQRLAGNAAVTAVLADPSVQRDDADSKGGTPPAVGRCDRRRVRHPAPGRPVHEGPQRLRQEHAEGRRLRRGRESPGDLRTGVEADCRRQEAPQDPVRQPRPDRHRRGRHDAEGREVVAVREARRGQGVHEQRRVQGAPGLAREGRRGRALGLLRRPVRRRRPDAGGLLGRATQGEQGRDEDRRRRTS